MAQDTELGLYNKYDVERLNDPEGKHDNCPYFVLDIIHDPHARAALWAYIDSVRDDFPQLAENLTDLLLDNPFGG